MDSKIENIIKVNVNDLGSFITPEGVNTIALVVVDGTVSTAKSYTSQDEIKTDFGDSSDAYKISSSFFVQSNRPSNIVIIPVDDETPSTITAAITDAINAGLEFYHIVFRSTASTAILNIALRTALETYASANYKIVHIEYGDNAQNADLITDAGTKEYKRTALYFHDFEEKETECFPLALCTARCSSDSARGTFALKGLVGITADSFTATTMKTATDGGINIYTKIGNIACTFFGTIDDAVFIDSQIKKDWIRFRVQEALFDALRNANNGDGADYSDAGIQGITGVISNVFATAASKDNRYIMEEYSVEAPKMSDIAAAKKAGRIIPQIKGSFYIMNSIHKIEKVDLFVQN